MTTGRTAAARLVDRFNDAWNDHDLDTAMAMVAEDCVFEATSPAPDGARHVGAAAVRAAWAPIFADTRSRFGVEASLVADDHVVQQWRYDWAGGHVRGVDVIHVTDGTISAKHSYVKG